MWTTEAKHTTNAPKERIWALWSDVKNWNEWDHEVERSEISGAFAVGTKGVLKPVGGPQTKFEIIDIRQCSSFTDRSFLPFCTMDFIHTMTEVNGRLEISHKVVMQGVMTFLFAKIIGKNIEKGLPTAVAKLVELAEKNQ
jgi:hypothetical protein